MQNTIIVISCKLYYGFHPRFLWEARQPWRVCLLILLLTSVEADWLLENPGRSSILEYPRVKEVFRILKKFGIGVPWPEPLTGYWLVHGWLAVVEFWTSNGVSISITRDFDFLTLKKCTIVSCSTNGCPRV